MIIINEVGNRYGKLVVMSRAKTKWGEALWLCHCDCGGEKNISGCSLRRGHSKSCGCSNKLEYGESSFKKMVRQIKDDAKRRHINFDLSQNEVRKITSMSCFYCGALPSNICTGTRSNGSYEYSGIDRADNNIGYTLNNIVPCCADCNKAKQTKTVPGFLEWFKKIAKYNNWHCDINSIKFKKLEKS